MWKGVLLLAKLLTICQGGVWLEAVTLNNDGKIVILNVNKDEFNSAFIKCPVVRYTRNGDVHSIYMRVSAVPVGFNAYDLFTYTWSSVDNTLHGDFEIYSNYADLLATQNEWQFCNYGDPGVGYPRDCGKLGKVDNEWFSLPGNKNAPGLSNGASFQIHQSCNCPVAYHNLNFEVEAICLSHDGKDVTKHVGRDKFNAAFAECPVVQYTRNSEVHSIYKRVSPIPDSFDAYNLFTSAWIEAENVLHEDFEIYSSYEDLKADQNEWSFCNYDDFVVGYPRDCGRDGYVPNKWFSFLQRAPGLTKGAGFAIHRSCNCPVKMTPREQLSSKSEPEKGRKVSDIKVYTNYEVSFTIRPIKVQSGWTNILHITTSGNTEGEMGSRIPAVFFWSSSTRLHITTGCDDNWNTHVDPLENLPIGKDTQVNIRVNGGTFTVLYDNRVVGRTTCANPFGPSDGQLGAVYLSDPWYPSSKVVVKNLIYSKLTEGLLVSSLTYPKATMIMGEVLVALENYELSFTINPRTTLSGWTEVLRVSSEVGNCCETGQRIPGLFFVSDTTKITFCTGCGSNGNTCMNAPVGLPLNQETKVIVRIDATAFTAIYNGTEIITISCISPYRPNGKKAMLYISSSYPTADVVMKELSYAKPNVCYN